MGRCDISLNFKYVHSHNIQLECSGTTGFSLPGHLRSVKPHLLPLSELRLSELGSSLFYLPAEWHEFQVHLIFQMYSRNPWTAYHIIIMLVMIGITTHTVIACCIKVDACPVPTCPQPVSQCARACVILRCPPAYLYLTIRILYQ
jgi:hypothetical protein